MSQYITTGDAIMSIDTTFHPGESIYDYMARTGKEMGEAIKLQQAQAAAAAAASAGNRLPGQAATAPAAPTKSSSMSTTQKLMLVGVAVGAYLLLTGKKGRK